MNKSTNLVKQTIGMSAVLTCGALLIGCAGNSPKPSAAIEPVNTAEQTVMIEQSQPATEPVNIEQSSTGQPTTDNRSAETEKSPDVIAALDSDAIETPKPEHLIFQFGFDKAELGNEDKALIKQHAKYLRENPQVLVKVVGHTDHHGPKAYNEYLSKKRAEAVTAVLLAEGVLESQIEIKAMANDRPLETAQRARDNRRVELQFEEVNLVSK